MQVGSMASLSGLRILHCHDLQYRLAAIALIPPLTWELPYAKGVALKGPKKKKLEPKVKLLGLPSLPEDTGFARLLR